MVPNYFYSYILSEKTINPEVCNKYLILIKNTIFSEKLKTLQKVGKHSSRLNIEKKNFF